MSFYALSSLIIVVTSTILGMLVYFKKRNSKVNQAFGLFSLSVLIWSGGYFFWQTSNGAIIALLWARILMAGAIFTSVTYLHFVFAFNQVIEKKKRFIILSYALFALFLFFDFTPYFIKGVGQELFFKFWPKPGIIFHPFLLIWFIYFIYSILLLLGNYKKSFGVKRAQTKYLFLGILCALVGGSTNYFLWYGIPIPPIGNILVVVYVGATAYAIIAHRLMDIKLVMRKYSVYLASLSSIIILAVGIKYLFDSYVARYTNWADFFILAGGVSVFPGIKNRYYFLANKYFFSSLYDSRQVIAGLSERLRSTLDIKAINKSIADTLINSFHAKAVAVLTYDEKTNEYAVQYNSGFALGGQKRFLSNDILRADYVLANKSIVMEELKENVKPEYKKTLALLLKFKVAILTPLNIKDKNIGLIALGRKESGDMYNNEDLQVLKVVGAQAAVAIEKALLYKQVHDFSRTLQGKVDEQTKDIRTKSGEIEEKNKYLKELLEMKTDFLRVVNHQLNTPLSVMKGYFSMMEEDAYPAEKALPSIKNGLERISSTVADFWNAYELEGERMKIEPQKADIAEIVSRLIPEKQNMQMARERKLSIEVKPPDFDLPAVWCDYKKISHVVSNLLDNAVYYTRQGKITVFYELADNYLKISVKDTGVGLSEEDKKKMFQKFSRGGNATDLRPDGSGLGLFIAKKIVEGNFGQMFCSSEGRDKGSTFSFTLPLHKDQRAEAAREKPVSREKIVIFNKIKQ